MAFFFSRHVETVNVAQEKTFYTRTGNWFAWLCFDDLRRLVRVGYFPGSRESDGQVNVPAAPPVNRLMGTDFGNSPQLSAWAPGAIVRLKLLERYFTVPLQITIDKTHRVIMMRGSGVLTDSDLALAHRQCETDPAVHRSFARICDLSEVDNVSISNESLDVWARGSDFEPARPSRDHL